MSVSDTVVNGVKRFQLIRAERLRRKTYEKQEALKDMLYDEYYERFALAHLNNIIISFGRQPQCSLKNAMRYAKHIGILQPHSDDILYMQNMKKASSFEYF